jgi:hypothetical protein
MLHYTVYVLGKGFGLVAAKMGIASVIGNFEVSPCAETLTPMRLNPKALIPAFKEEILLKYTKLSR